MKVVVFIFFSFSLQVIVQSQNLSVNNVRIVEDLSYYDDDDASKKHKLDLYIPSEVTNPPVVLWIHGGAWAFGGRKAEKAIAIAFASKDIAFAVISYRLSPALWANPPKQSGDQHPAHINDVAAAFTWLHDRAQDYGLDQSNIFVSGYSAGAHLSALLVLNSEYLSRFNQTIDNVKAVIPIAGAYDLMDYYEDHKKYRGKEFADQHVKGIFGNDEEVIRAASPTSWLQHSNTPMLVISESETYDYTRKLQDRVEELGITDIDFWHIKEETHLSLSEHLKGKESVYRDRIISYINKQVRNQ